MNGKVSRETVVKVDAFLEKYPMAAYGPAHIVLDDYNMMDGHIKWCLGLAKAALSKNASDLFDIEDDLDFMNRLNWYADDDPETLQETVLFLEELLAIPEDIR